MVGWIDPASGERVPFDEVLAQAEAYGQAMDMPFEVLYGMWDQAVNKDRPDGVTVTQLAGCLRRVELERTNDFYAEPQSTYAAFRGVLAHSIMEKYHPKGAMVEERYFRTYKGVQISGQLDEWLVTGTDPGFAQVWHEWLRHIEHVEGLNAKEQGPYWDGKAYDADECELRSNGVPCPARQQPDIPKGARFVIRDYKTKHELPTYTYLAKRYQKQANCYVWLLRLPEGRIDVEFIFMSMNGVKVQTMFDGGTFSNGRAKPEQFWTDKELEEYLDSRLLILQATRNAGRPLPYDRVEEEDLWNCDYCPVKQLCYKSAAEEARKSWAKGEVVDRLPPRTKKK
jgi:hypothetical protein